VQSTRLVLQGQVTLGVPAQQLQIEFSTQETDFVVVGTDCKGPFCTNTKFYNYTRTLFNKHKSLTYKDLTPKSTTLKTNPYGSGTYGRDYLQLSSGVGTYKGIKIVVMDSVKPDRFKYLAADGLFGLDVAPGKPGIAADTALNNLMQELDKPIFSIWMQDQIDPYYGGIGQVTFGSLDNENCDANWTFVQVPPTSAQWFLTGLTARFAHDVPVGDWCTAAGKGCTFPGANFFAEEPYIYAPEDFVVAMAQHAKATFSAPQDFFVDCSAQWTLPPLELTIGGSEFLIPATSYVLRLPGGSCKLGVAICGPECGKGNWVMGAPFYRSYCVAHDVANKRMGFAKSKWWGGKRNAAGRATGGGGWLQYLAVVLVGVLTLALFG